MAAAESARLADGRAAAAEAAKIELSLQLAQMASTLSQDHAVRFSSHPPDPPLPLGTATCACNQPGTDLPQSSNVADRPRPVAAFMRRYSSCPTAHIRCRLIHLSPCTSASSWSCAGTMSSQGKRVRGRRRGAGDWRKPSWQPRWGPGEQLRRKPRWSACSGCWPRLRSAPNRSPGRCPAHLLHLVHPSSHVWVC